MALNSPPVEVESENGTQVDDVAIEQAVRVASGMARCVRASATLPTTQVESEPFWGRGPRASALGALALPMGSRTILGATTRAPGVTFTHVQLPE